MRARLGHYEVLGEIARGGSGVVFRCRDSSGRYVAVKMLLTVQGPRAQKERARLQRELNALTLLRHPNLVTVLGAGEEAGRPWIAMELIEGESLQERINRGRLSPALAAGIILELAGAVQHAHAMGVLHRDIKPANVLLGPDDRPRLTDFGLAKLHVHDEKTKLSYSGASMGTAGYWPPEQARGELSRLGPASDVYALGATLYAALTGEVPFERDSLVASLVATCEEPPVPPSSLCERVDSALDAICLKCLEKEPSERYASAAKLATALERYLNGNVGAAPRRGGSRVVTALAGSLIVCGVAVGVFLAGDRSSPTPSEPAPTPSEPVPTPREPSDRPEPGDNAGLPPASPPPADSPSWKPTYYSPRDLGDLALKPDAMREECAKARAMTQRDPTGALAIVNRVLEVDPRYVRALNVRGHVFRFLKDWERALKDFELALRLEPNDAGHWSNRAIVRMELEDLAGARSDLDHSLELAKDATVYLNRGIVRAKAGDAQGGLEDLNEAVRLEPNDALAWTNRGTMRETLDDLDGAFRDHSRALELDSTDAGTWYNRAVIQIKREDYEGAFADLTRGRSLDPNAPKIHSALAYLLSRKGDVDAAREEYAEVLRLDPADATAWYNFACLEARGGRLDDARAHLEQAVEHGYDNADHMEQDSDLDSLRDSPWFRELLEGLRGRGRGETADPLR